jgi:two-component system chemotaxis sensor kinase CheA
MTLPLTLATFRGVLLECAQRRLIVPTAQVERALRFRPQDVRTVEGRNTLSLEERVIALADLAEVLQLPPVRRAADVPAGTPAVVLGSGEQRMAFAVDAVLDEREVLVKRLARPLSRVRNIAGATILGSGEVAPILNVADLLKSARLSGTKLRAQQASEDPVAVARRVLVAEDSITSRMLLKGILESAGYEVRTAVDGVEAFTALRAEAFDLVVSDVEMPRMNGFDLTARIRAERHRRIIHPPWFSDAIEHKGFIYAVDSFYGWTYYWPTPVIATNGCYSSMLLSYDIMMAFLYYCQHLLKKYSCS